MKNLKVYPISVKVISNGEKHMIGPIAFTTVSNGELRNVYVSEDLCPEIEEPANDTEFTKSQETERNDCPEDHDEPETEHEFDDFDDF